MHRSPLFSTFPIGKLAYILLVFPLLFSACTSPEVDYLNVLVFSKTAGFRHASIEDGKKMFVEMGETHGFSVDTTEDATVFDRKGLAKYNVIVFLSTTGDILDESQQTALEGFMKAGGGWMGVHAAADSEYDWPWYNQLVGAYFNGHPNSPNVREADVIVEDHDHPATAHLQDRWHRSDEWYNYRDMADFHPLMRLDETTYEGGTNGDNHPISWTNDVENGRMFYTGLGHTSESFQEADFIQHVWGGLQYVAGKRKKLDFSDIAFTPEENRFNVEAIVTGLYEPMEMDILPDGRVLWIQRRGEIRIYDPEYDATTEVNKMDVWTKNEDGLLGLALDPDFKDNNWVYLYYSPNTDESVNQLSRFKWTGNNIDYATEQKILTVPVDRNECCHSGGSIEFGPKGHLFLSVGDNTNPFDSEGFAPIDDSKDQGNWDARRSASNSMDLRGKILKIKVNEDGSYTTPDDNLFPDGKEGRPEIYVMGCRNPFRISIDQQSGVLYWGDVGPDAGRDSTAFGPRGHCEVNFAPTAGYYGWPLFVADNKPYKRRDFTTDTGGEAFDPLKPINDSRYNTGLKELPPARPAMIFYPYAVSEEFPSLGSGGRNPMAGPVYHVSNFENADYKLPDYYDGKFFFYEWMRDWIMAAELDETGKVVSFERFMPNNKLLHPMDMLFGKDGSLYILEYGTKWFSENENARILRIRYNAGNRKPVPAMEVAERIGALPFQLLANIGASEDFDGDELTAKWLLDGEQIGEGEALDYAVLKEGVLKLTLELDDGQGNVVTEEKEIIIGNNLPEITMTVNGNRSFYFGDVLDYSVEVSDKEDGKLNAGIDPAAVTVSLDYVEGEDLIKIEYGHQTATEKTQFLIGKKLIGGSDCAGCHLEREQNIGPSYLAVAQKYSSEIGAVAYLSGKIIKGGGGVWGEQAMAAHPQLTENEALQMANYILGMAGSTANRPPTLPLAGKEKLNQHRAGIPGRYYFQASYTDQGGKGSLPRLTSREVVVLRSPVLPAHQFTEGNKVMEYHVEAKDNPASDKDMDILVATGGGWAGYGEVDLEGISSVEAIVMLMPNITSGGTIEAVIGHPKSGQVVGTATVKQGLTTYGRNEVTIPVNAGELEGLQPIYFRFKADSDSAEAVMGAILSFTFKAGEPTNMK